MYFLRIMHGVEANVENKEHSRRYYGASAKLHRKLGQINYGGGMYPRRYALCIRDDNGNKDHSRCYYGVSGKVEHFWRRKWDLPTTSWCVRRSPINWFQFCESQNQNERVRKKGRNKRWTISASCPITVALAAIRPCCRLPPYIEVSLKSLIFRFRVDNLGF